MSFICKVVQAFNSFVFVSLYFHSHLCCEDPLEVLDVVALRLGGAPQSQQHSQAGGVALLLALDVSDITREIHANAQLFP